MTFTLPDEARIDLIDHIKKFCSIPVQSRGTRHSLREWQQLAGWLNWSFNVFPLLRPCLNNVYPKISGKDNPNASIWVNNSVRDDLMWAVEHITSASGIFLLRALDWDPSIADITIYCDASLEGMGFWYPEHCTAFYSAVPLDVPRDFIFYYEALCVLSAFHHATRDATTPLQLVIFTDNTNTVDIFHSLRALPPYNSILKSSVDIRMNIDHQLRVLHVMGHDNEVADAISRRHFARALSVEPRLLFDEFQPPRLPLGATKKMIQSGIRSKQPRREPWSRERLEHERAIALGQSIDPNTWRNYGSALNSYLDFVKNHHFPVDPTPDTLSFYIVYMSYHIKPDSVDTYLSGISQQLEPFFPQVRNNRKSPLVRRTLDG